MTTLFEKKQRAPRANANLVPSFLPMHSCLVVLSNHMYCLLKRETESATHWVRQVVPTRPYPNVCHSRLRHGLCGEMGRRSP